ncbi:MAG: hypothetical protein AAF281_01425 [Pseudomonadota bacterium]
MRPARHRVATPDPPANLGAKIKKTSLIPFAKTHWPVVLILLGSTLTALWFAGTFVLDILYFNDPQNKDVALKPWMTPRYVGMSYDLPRPVILELFDLPDDTRERPRMGAVADTLGLTLDELTARVRQAAAEHRGGDL